MKNGQLASVEQAGHVDGVVVPNATRPAGREDSPEDIMQHGGR